MQRELGRVPRAIVWPFGRYSSAAVDIARQAGFSWALTLDEGPSSALNPMSVSRHFPSADPSLDTLASMVRNDISFASAQRWVCLNPATLWTGDLASTDERLGQAIERYRTLGVTGVVIDAAQAGADGGLADVWFPTTTLPVRADLLSRLVWQLQTRAGLEVQVRLSARQALRSLGSLQRVLQLFDDLGTYVPLGGLWVDDALGAVGGEWPSHSGHSWEIRAARDALDATALVANDALTLQAFRAVQRSRPWLQLALASSDSGAKGLSPLADVRWSVTTLQAASESRDATHAAAYAAMAPAASARLYRSGVWLSSANPPQADALAAAVLKHQRLGERVLGWCADDPVSNQPDAFRAAPGVSGATFPVKF
jgi:poly-beta-1,6-N-acetyl-D-glucosamine N-deacetylase